MSYSSAQPYVPQPAAQSAWATQGPPVKTEAAAIVALILALSSMVVWIVPALVAIPLAAGAKRNIKASGGLRRGNGLALAAQIISWVALALTAAGLAAIALA